MKTSTLFAILAATALATIAVITLTINIFERKLEGRHSFTSVVDLTDEIEDPAVWGRNFPQQYADYLRTVDQTRTRYGGSEAMPHSPTKSDPRSVTSQSRLEEDPRLKTMWAGYPFSVDFREERGHVYMLDDQRYTKRVLDFKQPGTCLQCHASAVVAMRKAGGGDPMKGFDAMNAMSYNEANKLVSHPVACIDCHEPVSMKLRVTRPAFLEGIRSYKASQGVANYDPNTMASPQEMRSFVCGQCHAEYYFKGLGKRLVFPWAKGLKLEEIYAYYEENGHKDFVHADTGTPALKAQHPEFEMWSQGVHRRVSTTLRHSGVEFREYFRLSCVVC